MPAATTLTIILVAVAVVTLLAVAVIAFQERSARKTKRRAKGGAKSFAAGIGLGVAGLAGVIEGLGMGFAGAFGQVGAIFLSHPSFVVDLGLIGLGTLVLSGASFSLPLFLTIAFGIVALGLALEAM